MYSVALIMAIVKILSRHSPSYASLLRYVMRYVVDEGKTEHTPIYTNNLRSHDMQGYVREFIENEAFRQHPRSDQINLFHEIVSFHSDEDSGAITREVIDDLVAKYIELRGSTSVILAAPHFDKDHVHIHFCVSALHFRTGKSFGLGKAQLHELKAKFQQYHRERYPQIEKSFPKHGKGREYASHAQWHAKQREQIIETVRHCFARATSQKEFLELLRDRELHYYERNSKPTGITYDGQKFRFSRLIDGRRVDDLPIERSEEERALAEIQAMRKRQQGRDEIEHETDERER
jgi:hypothetical protein